MRRGAHHYMSKPVDADQILAVYERLRVADAARAQDTSDLCRTGG